MSRPLPQPTDFSAPFWSACREGRLLLQRCRDCQALQYFPRSLCQHCLSDQLDWFEASGRGEIYSFTIVRRALFQGFEEDVPYVVAIVQLEEGPHLLSQVVNCDPVQVVVGMHVTTIFTPVSEDISLPHFTPMSKATTND